MCAGQTQSAFLSPPPPAPLPIGKGLRTYKNQQCSRCLPSPRPMESWPLSSASQMPAPWDPSPALQWEVLGAAWNPCCIWVSHPALPCVSFRLESCLLCLCSLHSLPQSLSRRAWCLFSTQRISGWMQARSQVERSASWPRTHWFFPEPASRGPHCPRQQLCSEQCVLHRMPRARPSVLAWSCFNLSLGSKGQMVKIRDGLRIQSRKLMALKADGISSLCPCG